MGKLLTWLNDKFLPWWVAFLLIFIPLYPKLPLLGVAHTWVYIRFEDIFIAIAVGIYLLAFLQKKIKPPPVMSRVILLYWLVGFISTFIAIVFIFPHLANVFPNVAIFHYLRRIEYLSLFFVAAGTIRKGTDIYKYIMAIAIAMFGVILYGFGQRFLGLPAYLTMNEEFAKGIPLYLPVGARITSTFGGHYDLAAFLVVNIALLGSLIFGVRKSFFKLALLVLCVSGLSLLLLTASRVSFAVYLLTISFMLVLQKKKLLIIPVVIVSLILLAQVRGTADRFAKTFRIQPIVINTKTGQPIAVLEKLPPEISGLKPTPTPVQEVLPLGTGFIGLPPISSGNAPEATTVAIIRKQISASLKLSTISSEISTISGSFLIQKAFVYDISFTTRFQGEWPRAWQAFVRNPITGSGYSSINLATDNDYLRLLGESGLLGFLSFLLVFATYFILVKKMLAKVVDKMDRSFVIGVSAGLFGLGLNAILIDVFEASKVAFTLWLLLGLSVVLMLLHAGVFKMSLWQEIKKLIFSTPAIFIYLFLINIAIYNQIFNSYFSGEDFIWLKWAAETKLSDIVKFFYETQGYYFRPLTKILYFLSYSVFWFKPFGYHFISLMIYFVTSFILYLISHKLFNSKLLAFLSSVVFIVMPLNSESVMWISFYSSLLFSLFTLLIFLNLISYKKSGGKLNLIGAIAFFLLALLSHHGIALLPLGSAIFSVTGVYLGSKVTRALVKGELAGKLLTVIFVGIFFFFSYEELGKEAKNWYRAGETAKKIVYALKDNYRSFPLNSTLYFTNILDRIGKSWVFPVGLPQAIWFVYRDKTMKVIREKDVETALKLAESVPNSHVFSFEDNELKEISLK